MTGHCDRAAAALRQLVCFLAVDYDSRSVYSTFLPLRRTASCCPSRRGQPREILPAAAVFPENRASTRLRHGDGFTGCRRKRGVPKQGAVCPPLSVSLPLVRSPTSLPVWFVASRDKRVAAACICVCVCVCV